MAEPTPLESLQQKLDTNSLNPREYNREQLSTIDNLIEQGVLKGPRMNEIVQNFNATAETLAKEKEFAKDPLGVALQDRSIFQGELTGLIPTRPGAELVGDVTGSLLPYLRNKDVLINSLKLPKAAQNKLFTQKAIELSRYLEKIPRIGKAFKFTRGILMGAAKAADAATSARLKPLIATEIQSVIGGAVGAAGAVGGYDLINRNVGKDLAIAINQDLANLKDQDVQSDTGTAMVEAFKNSMYWGAGASALLPVAGGFAKGIKSLFGLKGDKALELAQFAYDKGLPIPLLAAMEKGPLSGLGKSYFKTVGVFPFVSKIGDQALRDAELKYGKAFLSDLAGLAPITRTSALSVASMQQFKKQFETYANLISDGYTNFMRHVDDVGNPQFIKLDKAQAAAKEFMDEWSQQIPRLKAMSDYGDDAIKFADYRKMVFEELSDNNDPLVQLMGYLSYAKGDIQMTAKEFAGLQRLATRAIEKTNFFDARKSIFKIKDGFDMDFATSAAKIDKNVLLGDTVVKAEYEKALAEGGQVAADRYLNSALERVSGLNQQLKLANAQFNQFLKPYEKSAVAAAIKAGDKSLFTNKQLYGIGGRESIPMEQVFTSIEKAAFKSGNPGSIEELKHFYGYNTSKAGKEMFNRAFSRHIYDAYLKSFSEESLKTGSAFDLLKQMQTSKPKTHSMIDDVLESGGMRDLYAARNVTVKDVLSGQADESIQITFGKGDFAEFSADKFRAALGFDGPAGQEARRMMIQAYGGGMKGAQALDNLEKFINYTKALSDVPISETSAFLQRRLTLSGGAGLLGGVVMGGGMFAANPLAPLVFLYASRKIGKVLTDPEALRRMMDVLSPAERLAFAKKDVGVKSFVGIPVTVGETKARAFARFANYMAEEDVDLPKVDPNKIDPQEIIDRLSNIPMTIPKKGFNFDDLPKEERERIAPEREMEKQIPTSLLVEATGFADGFNVGENQAIQAVNVDYGIQPSPEAEQQGQQTTIPGINQIPTLQAPAAPEAPQVKQQKFETLFPFDVTGQMIAGQGGTTNNAM
jgi:hypothetical protein